MDKKLIHSVLSHVCQTHPNHIAIVQEERQLCYQELNQQANAVAWGLIDLAIVPGDVIALALEPSIDYLVAMLGILKAGAVVLPLDSNTPTKRLDFILDKCQPKFIISNAVVFLSAPAFQCHAICDLITDNITELPLLVSGDDSAYVIFTSGSTGNPKAIEGQHKGLSHFIHWEIKEFAFDQNCKACWIAPPTFDVSLRDIFVPLLSGGTLFIPSPEIRGNSQALLSWIAQQKITLIHCVPSLFRLFINELDSVQLPYLKYILLAGEPLYAKDVLLFRERCTEMIELVNLYGPSETTLAKAFYRIPDLASTTQGILPIGQAIANSALLIIKNGRLCNIGEIGEIYIKTPFRSKGYYHDEALTQQVFVQNPLNSESVDIVYKTGDSGRYLENHAVAFLGRTDNQVKINGVRIELAEIEQALLQHPAIRQAVVVVQKNAQQEQALVAYIVADETLDNADIREHLGAWLPSYMLPQFYVSLAQLPLNLHGKVDRKALPKADALLYQSAQFVPPQGVIEMQLAQLWQEILGLEKVGVTHSFMDLGGDSLKAMRMVSGIYKTLQLDISLKDFFAHSTIRELALLCAAASTNKELMLTAIPLAADYPLSHAQKRLWLMEQMHIDSVAYNLPETLLIKGALNLAALQAGFDAVLQRHEALRTYFVEVKGEPRQKIAPQITLTMTLTDISHETDKEQRLQDTIERDLHAAFNLAAAPLFRVSVLKIAENSHVLLFNIHHIISDGWSLGVLTREWMQAYAAYIQGESLALAPLTLQYKDYAAWQVAYLQSEMAAKHRHYWLEKFSGEIPVLNLETDCPRPLMQTFAGHTLHFVIAEHRLQAFNAVLNEHAASLFMGLMAVLKVLLLRYSGQQDLIVGTPVRGRMQQELEAQMGFYVNTLALRDVLDPQSSFIQVLEQVKLTATEAFDHQVYPFDQLVDELDLQRDMSRSPLFDVMLALQNIEPVQLSLDQLSVSQYDQENHWDISRFDLMFHFNETSEGLALALNYNTDLFTEERIQRLAEHYLQLLDSVVDAPQQAIKQLNFLSAQEKQWLLTANPQALAALPQFTISERFALQVKTTPENIALIKGSTVLSYRQLQQQVDALSGALYQALGAQHERQAVVGVYSERLEPVYLLACLQIGAVYVPLDSHLPEQRIQYMLSTAKCDLLLHGQNVTVPIALQQQCVCFCADNMETRAAVHATYNGQDLAYILFTSGSTGQPKGVMVRHQGFVAMALAQGALFKLTPQSRVLQFAAIGFDASLSEVFMAWFSGASLVLIDQPTISDAHRFLAFINSQQVTHLTLPPVYLKALNQAPMPSVEVLITAGEAAVIEDALYYARHCHYFNAYGPTEASVCASVYQVDPEQQYAQRVPIGKPLAHLAIFILDTAQNLLPQGLIGEIYIAGEGVASGYVGAAELTAQSFVSLPYLSAKPLYKTGDLGRWNSAGDLEFFGRNDAQIKLSGYRIETEEIAQTLMQHPAIAQAYVTVQHDQHAQPSLCAFYTLQQRCELWPSIAEFYVYDDVVYGSMANDERRNARYRRAFAKALPGKIVVEIGPGPELILSRLALEAGARKIYAIELLAETFHKARQTLKRLGLEDKITLIHGNALEVQLPEKVDYCISEIVGGIGGSEGAAKIINSARRFLKQPENMLPMRSLTKLAAIHLPETAYAYHFSPIATHYVERIFAQLGYPFDLRLCLKNLPDSAIISSSDALEDLDYTQDIPLECAHSIRLEFNQRSVFNGFLAWLNLYPDQDELIDILDCNDSWLPVYFPVSLSGISVEPGDILTATVTRRLCDNQLNPDYFISGQLIKQTGETIAVDYQAYHQQQRFRATPFYQQLFNAKADIPLREPLASNELRGFLAQTLAPYMLPQHFIELEQFPVNRNGKLDVKALPSAFDVSGQMLDEHYQAARNSTEQLLIDIWQDVLDQTAIGVHDHYFHRGGDSIRAIQIIARLRDAGLKLEVRDIFQQPTIAQLARLVTHIEHTIDQAPVSGEIPLTPIQHWFLQSANPVKHHFNQAVVLRFNEALQLDLFQQCLEALVQQHDMLRTSFQVDGELTKQICAEQVKVMVQLMDLREQSAIEQKMHLHADQVQAQLALQGNLFQAVIYRCADADHVLLYCHHLLIDGVSWRILLADLAHYYQQLLNQANVTLLLKTDAFKTHAQVLLDYAGSDALQAQLSYWQAIAQQVPVVATMNATVADAQTVSFTLSAADTRELLADCHKAFNTRVDDILLAALALSFSQWQQQAAVLIELEGHGRHELAGINTQRTVGWFTTAFPHVLSVTAGEDLANLIKVTKEDLRKIPEQGLGYGVLRYLSEVRDLACQPDVGFNYLGQFDALSQEGLFQVDWQGLGQNISSQTPLLHQIDFLGLVTQQVMQLQITFNSLRYSRAEIEQLSDLYQANLKALCAFCMQREQSELTPADLSFQDISMAELDDLFDA